MVRCIGVYNKHTVGKVILKCIIELNNQNSNYRLSKIATGTTKA